MTGVEVLNQYTEASLWSFNYWVALICFGILLICIIMIALYTKDWTALFFIVFAVFVSVFVGTFFGSIAPLECHQETHYEVTIDDSVSMNEFLDKYEILDQEGKIYTVKERE